MQNMRNKSVDTHAFSMIPSMEVPRSSFKIETAHKTTFDGGYLIPFYIDEVLPGDTFRVNVTAFARMSTPLFPVMDNLHMDTFFFFVPWRILWTNFVKMMGEQDSPGDSISYIMPISTSPVGGYTVNSLQDYMGLPTVGQVGGAATFQHNTMPLRAYNKIWQDWFRDENLQNAVTIDKGDGPDTTSNYVLLRRGKRHDYFTSSLPWPQKGNTAVSLPLGTRAPISGIGVAPASVAEAAVTIKDATTTPAGVSYPTTIRDGTTAFIMRGTGAGANVIPDIYADLSTATAATINQLRQAFTIQQLLEKDARGGTRYTESTWVHFKVKSPDARLQRPEYLGGGSNPIIFNPIAQTSATGVTGGSTALGNLSAMATGISNHHGFSQSFTEHGTIIGLVSVRADLTYQQGLRKMWSRSTRYDIYYPVFANLGEQAVLNKEIYCDGSANDSNVWGYQERWAEYRHHPPMITGLFRSTSTGTIDPWHLAQKFTALPTLNNTFIQDAPPIDRIVAVGAAALGKQFIFDSFIQKQVTRPMPLYSIPGLNNHL